MNFLALSYREELHHSIINDRIENYGSYIVFISKYHCCAEGCLSIWEIDQLCSPPPPPSPTYRPHLDPIPIPIWAVCGCVRGCRVLWEESLSISHLLRNSGAPSALKQIVHKSSYLYSLFHSVIYNSVNCI